MGCGRTGWDVIANWGKSQSQYQQFTIEMFSPASRYRSEWREAILFTDHTWC